MRRISIYLIDQCTNMHVTVHAHFYAVCIDNWKKGALLLNVLLHLNIRITLSEYASALLFKTTGGNS